MWNNLKSDLMEVVKKPTKLLNIVSKFNDQLAVKRAVRWHKENGSETPYTDAVKTVERMRKKINQKRIEKYKPWADTAEPVKEAFNAVIGIIPDQEKRDQYFEMVKKGVGFTSAQMKELSSYAKKLIDKLNNNKK